jgi:hypothetical protein
MTQTIFQTAYKQVETIASNSAWRAEFWKNGKHYVQETRVVGAGTSAQPITEVREL